MARASTFTSYINAELPSNLDGTWRRYEQIATSTFSNIERRAEQASRAVAGLSGGRGAGGIGLSSGAASKQARQMREVERVNKSIEQSTRKTAQGFDRQTRAMRGTAAESGRVVRGLSAVSTSLNIVQGPLGPLAGRVSALSRALGELTGYRLGIAGIASSLFILGSVGNSYAALEGQLRGAFIEQTRVNQAMGDVERIARNARTALDPVAETYIKLTKAGEAYNISAERSARLVETVTKAAVLSGGSRQAQEAGITQFGQAFASGNLAGDELRSIRENSFVLAQALATGLGVTVGELKELGAAGELTTERLADALEKASIEIDARFSVMPKTISQGLTELRNAFTLTVGSADQALGFSNKVAGAMSALAGAIRPITAGIIGLGAAFATVKAAKLASELQGSINQYRAMNKSIQTLAQTRKADAEANVAFTQRSITGLNQQQAEIRETIALRQREAQLAQQDLRRMRADPTASSARIKAALREQVAAQQALNAVNRQGVATADSLAAAERRLETAKTRLTRATKVAEGRQRSFGRAISALVGNINPLGIAIGIATAAIITMMTKASAATTVIGEFSSETVDAARKAIGLAEANTALANSYYEVARAMGRKALAEAEEKSAEVNEEFSGRLRQVALQMGPGAERDRLNKWAKLVEKGTANLGMLNGELREMEKLNPRAFGQLDIGIAKIGPNTSLEGFDESTIAARLTRDEIKRARELQEEIDRDIKESEERLSKPSGPKPAAVSASGLRTQAQADAIDSGTSAIRAAGIRRKDALRALDEELGVSAGKVPGANAEEYRTRAAEIERMYNAEVEGAKAARSARSAGARESRAAARQEIKDNRELAESRLQLGLLEIEQNKPNMSQEEYYQARLKLLETYDAEIEAADSTASNVSKAIGQMIKDTREMQKSAETLAEKRRDMLGGWEDAPKALTRARDQIDDLQRAVGQFIETGPGQFELYTAEQASRDAARIMEGVVRPLAQASEQAQRFREISQLQLEGYDVEAEALERALQLQDEIGRVTRARFEVIVSETEEQRRINAELARRDRLLDPILNSVTQTRDQFEDMLVNLPDEGLKSVTGFLKSVEMNMRRIWARKVSETLFGGAEERMRELLGTKQGGVDAAYEYLAKHAKATGAEFEQISTSGDRAATALERLATAADSAGTSLPGGVGGTAANSLAPLLNASGAGGAGALQQGSLAAGMLGLPGIAGVLGAASNVITVTGSRSRAAAPESESIRSPSSSSGLRALGDTFGDQLNKTFGTDFFGGMGDVFAGAGTGMMASGVADMLGIKQSSTGAAIGGAIGSAIPIPGGSIIGGLLGGTIGGMLGGSKRGSAIINGSAITGYYGNSSANKSAAGTLAGDVFSQLESIADAIGATINPGAGRVSIGIRDGNYRVDPQGRGYTKTSKFRDIMDFGEDAQAAVAAAVKNLIQDGVLEGISQASQRILRAASDVEAALEKVVAIESIPKRLRQLKDPVGFAIDELNTEFAQLISYLKEGGATAQQFSEAQELYDLERARAIEQATQNAVGAIEEFMENMISSNSSPLNKRTVYGNAQETLQELAERINRGEAVDQNELTSAASNFQDASRNLFGSSAKFFEDFDMLYALLGRAKGNFMAGGVDESGNPLVAGSPFDSDPTVRATIDQYRGVESAIGTQTDTLASILRDIRSALGTGADGTRSPIPALPGFGGGGRRNFRGEAMVEV